MHASKVARWQNLIPSFLWIAPGWRAWGCNPNFVIWQPCSSSVITEFINTKLSLVCLLIRLFFVRQRGPPLSVAPSLATPLLDRQYGRPPTPLIIMHTTHCVQSPSKRIVLGCVNSPPWPVCGITQSRAIISEVLCTRTLPVHVVRLVPFQRPTCDFTRAPYIKPNCHPRAALERDNAANERVTEEMKSHDKRPAKKA